MTSFPFTTPRDLLRYALSRFHAFGLVFGHGCGRAFDEAAYLILHTLNLPLDQLEPFLDAKLLPDEISEVLHVIDRRCHDRLPAAYITRQAWLGEYCFYVDERVIVPRSFIAEFIPHHFSPWIQVPEQVGHILDLCTGSACLPILLADAFPHAMIDAVDISSDALAVARHNLENYGLHHRIHLIESDLYQQVSAQKKYDIIVSNPPYVTHAAMATLPPEYQHEPALALAGGEDGMDVVRRIVSKAKKYLSAQGFLIIEIGQERVAAEKVFPDLPLTWLTTSAGDGQVFLLAADQL